MKISKGLQTVICSAIKRSDDEYSRFLTMVGMMGNFQRTTEERAQWLIDRGFKPMLNRTRNEYIESKVLTAIEQYRNKPEEK